MESSASSYHDSPYQDSPSSSSVPILSAQAAFEAEASRLRARMPYDRSPPAPVQFPTDTNGRSFAAPISQMSRSGRPPGAPREPDFYEILSPHNKRLTKLYVSAGVLSAAGTGALVYSWALIRWEKLFSDAAKGVMLATYEAGGLGGVVCLLFPGLIYCVVNLASLINHSAPLPEVVGAITNSALSILLVVFVFLSAYDLKHEGQEHSQEDGKWNPCLAPGADQWKRLSCGEANDKVKLIQLLGLLAAASAAFLCLFMAILHAVETKKNAGSGRWLERRKGYVRLEQNSLDPYQIHEDDDADSERSRGFR